MKEPVRMELQVGEFLDAPGVVSIGASWGANAFHTSVHDGDPSVAGHHPELAQGLRASLGGADRGTVAIQVWEDGETGDVRIGFPKEHGLVTSVNDRPGDPRCHVDLTRMLRLAIATARAKERRARDTVELAFTIPRFKRLLVLLAVLAAVTLLIGGPASLTKLLVAYGVAAGMGLYIPARLGVRSFDFMNKQERKALRADSKEDIHDGPTPS